MKPETLEKAIAACLVNLGLDPLCPVAGPSALPFLGAGLLIAPVVRD